MCFSRFKPLRALAGLLACFMIAGCYSQKTFDDYTEKRRQRLLEMYPVRKTTRKDVEARWGFPPQIKSKRPSAGWKNDPDIWVKNYATKAETRIGKKIAMAERYYGPDGMFSLCYCWFYYDSSGRLLDAEWQWSSD